MNNTVDIRIVKSKNLLCTSLIEIMKNVPFDKIKVLDLCRKSQINRSTFYMHYKDKYELLIDVINRRRNSLD